MIIPRFSGGGRLRLVTATALMFILFTGCSTPPEEQRFLSFDEIDAVYAKEVSTFPWELPSGVEFPEHFPAVDNGALWERGNGRSKAYFFWQCEWVKVHLNERDFEPELASKALDLLKAADGDPYLDSIIEDPSGGWRSVLDKAGLGDASELASYAEVTCVR